MGIILLLVIGIAVWGIWEARRRSASPPRHPVAAAPPLPELDRWVSAGLMGADQAAAIRTFESTTRAEPPSGSIPVVAEVIGYAGAALAAAGAAVGFGEFWEDMAGWTRIGLLGLASALLIVGGWLLRHSEEPAFRRMRSALWFLSIGFLAASIGVLWADKIDLSDEYGVLVVGASVTAVALLLWWWYRTGLQQFALFGGAITTIVGGLNSIPGTVRLPWHTLGLVVLGLLWAALGRRRLVEPDWLAMALGITLALVAPVVAIEEYGWVLAPALVMSIACMVASVPLEIVPMAVMGAAATFVYVIWGVVRYFGDTLGVPVALAAVGTLMIAVAIAVGRDRLTRFFRPRTGVRPPL